MEDLKYIIDSYGSKTAVLFLSIIGFIYLIKLIVEKIFDNYILKKKKKEIIEYENAIQRSTIAYKLLLEKELEFYEKYFDYASELVTDIQDIEYNYLKFNKKLLKKYILKVLEVIPKLKKDAIVYEAYYDSKIRKAIISLIKVLQDDFAHKIEKIMAKEVKNEKVKMLCDDVLKKLALISSLIYLREEKMSN